MSEKSEHSPDDTETETKVMDDIPNDSSKSETKLLMNQMDAALLEDEEMPTYISMSSTTRPDDSDINAKQSENESQIMERERSTSPYPSDDQEANSIYVVSSGEETDQHPYNDEDDEDEYGDSDDMENLELDNEFNSERSSNMKQLMDDDDDEEEDDEDEEDEEDSLRQIHNDDEGIEDHLEMDCYDGRSDDFLLNRRLKNRDKERSLSLQDLNTYRNDMNTDCMKKRHLQGFKPNRLNIPEQQAIMYSMIQKKRPVLGKYHYVQSKVKRYIKDIKEQNRHSLKKQHVEQQQENTNYNINNSNHKNNDTEKPKSTVTNKTIKGYAERTIKELEEIAETFDSNADKMAYSAAILPQIILNGQDNKNGLELVHEESTQNEIQITSYESTQNERDLANTDSKMQKQNGTIDTKQLKLNYPDKEISHFEDTVQPQLIQNGHQRAPTVRYHLRTLSYEEYMHGTSDSSQKTDLNRNAHVVEQDPLQLDTYNNSDLMDISAENDDSCPLRIENIKSIKTMSDEVKKNNEQVTFKKINECSSNTIADSSEVTTLKKKLTQKTVKYNNLLDTYQKQLMENLKMKQELDELRKILAKYEKENKTPEQKVVSIQTDAVIESVPNQSGDQIESTQISQSNNKMLGNSVASLSSIEQWSSSAGNLSISMKPPEVAKTLHSDDSMILTDSTPSKKHALSRAFITSSRILQTLSNITQGKTKPESPLTQNSKKRINENVTIDLQSDDSSQCQPSSSKKRKVADFLAPPNFVQTFKASETATESHSKLNEMLNIESQFKNACNSINKNINLQASSSNTNVNQLEATTSTTENKTNANDDAEDNVKCFIYHEDENSKERSFLILAEESEINEKGRIRECGPFLLGNIEVRMSEINGTINIWGKEISQESTAEIETETSSNMKDNNFHWQKTPHTRFNGSSVVCSTSRKSKNPPKFELSSAASNYSCLHSPSFNVAKASCSTDKQHADKSCNSNMFSFENCDPLKHRNEWLRCKRIHPQEKLHSCCIHNTDTSEEKCNCSLHKEKQKFEDNFNCSKEKCNSQERQRSFSKNLESNKHLYENITPEDDHICRNDTSCHHSLHDSENCQEHKCNKETCELLINREFSELCNHSPSVLHDEEPLISPHHKETPDTKRRRLTGKRVRGILMDLLRGCGDCYNPNVSDNTSKSCMHKKDSYLHCPPEIKISPCASPEPSYSRTGQPAGRCCHAYAQRIESQLEEFRMEMEKMRSRSDAILNMLNMLHSVDTN